MTKRAPRRAAIYCRISRDSEKLGLGVERQERECRALAAERGWIVAEVLVDNDVSAVSDSRAGWRRLLAGIEHGHYDGALAVHPDRLYRRLSDLSKLIDTAQRAGSVPIATVRAGDVDLSTTAGRLVASLIGSVAAAERENTSERVKSKLADRAAQGLPSGRPAFGWSRTDRAKLEPREALVVVGLAAGALAGLSLRQLARDMNARDVPAPRAGAWTASKVRDVLLRPANAGLLARDGEVVGRGVWEPILPESEHHALVALLTDPARKTTANPTARHLLSGVARCGVCQAFVWARAIRGRPKYYCQAAQHVTRDQAAVDDLVTRVIVGRLARPDAADLVRPPSDEGRALAGEVDALRRRISAADEAMSDGALTPERWRRLSDRLAAELGRAEAALRAIRAPSPLDDLVGAAGEAEVAARWAELPPARRRQIAALLLDVTILPTRAGQRIFDPSRIEIEWRA